MASRTRAGYGGEDARWLRGRESGARASPVRRLRGRSGMLFSWSVSYRAGASGPLFRGLPCGVLETFPQNGHLAYARGRDKWPPGGCARPDAPLRCPGDREPRPRNRRSRDADHEGSGGLRGRASALSPGVRERHTRPAPHPERAPRLPRRGPPRTRAVRPARGGVQPAQRRASQREGGLGTHTHRRRGARRRAAGGDMPGGGALEDRWSAALRAARGHRRDAAEAAGGWAFGGLLKATLDRRGRLAAGRLAFDGETRARDPRLLHEGAEA